MICFQYAVRDSLIECAGKGLFTTEALPAGKVLVAPVNIRDICDVDSLTDDKRAAASVRWFETTCSVAEDWPDECYINHSFNANALWHLGFTISLRHIAAGEEITMDYSHLLADGVTGFRDAETNRDIRGLPWLESFSRQLNLLQQALHCA
jgi:hypothetical protein